MSWNRIIEEEGREIRDEMNSNQSILDSMNQVKDFISESGYKKENFISELDTLIDAIEETQSVLQKSFPAIYINFLVVNTMKEYLSSEEDANAAYNWCEYNSDLIVNSWCNLFSSFTERDRESLSRCKTSDERESWIYDTASEQLDMDIFGFQGEFLSSVGHSGVTEENDLRHCASIWLAYKFDQHIAPEFGGKELELIFKQ